MHFSASLVALFVLLPAYGMAAPAAASKSTSKAAAATGKPSSTVSKASSAPSASATMNMGTAGAAGMVPSDTQISNAVMSWMNDTGKVSKFLNTATSLTGDEYTKQATIALNAEIDELNHKMILDMAIGSMSAVQQANDTLATQGTFQAVVDALASMMTNGPDTAQADVTAINNNRCVNVLPNIDMYFAAAGMPDIKSVRPSGCLEVSNDVAVNPSVVPNGVGAAKASSAPKAAGNASDPAAAADAGTSSITSSASAKATIPPKAAASGKSSAPKGVAGATGKMSSNPPGAAKATGAGAGAAKATGAASKPAVAAAKATPSKAAKGADN